MYICVSVSNISKHLGEKRTSILHSFSMLAFLESIRDGTSHLNEKEPLVQQSLRQVYDYLEVNSVFL